MFLDIATIFVKAGNGGDGIVSFHTEKYVAKGGPDGGDGGNDGPVIFALDTSLSTLTDFRFAKHFRAENGVNGSAKNCTGRSGKDLVIKVPRGTIIREKASGRVIADMFYPDKTFVYQRGGAGGKGNAHFDSAQRKAPVGFTNVGKYTILSVKSGAKPKIANYHFTTLSPNLGVVKAYDKSFVMADIPGLIEGASNGAGLGHKFLRHIERVRLIIHVVDISAIDGRDPYNDYIQINEELKQYSERLASLPQIVCLNKCDLLYDDSAIEEFEHRIGRKTVRLSALTHSGVKELIDIAVSELGKLPPAEPMEIEEYYEDIPDKSSFTISRADDGSFIVEGGLIDTLARNVVLSDYESSNYFYKTLKDRGVIKALIQRGIKEGDTVRIKDIEFEYYE